MITDFGTGSPEDFLIALGFVLFGAGGFFIFFFERVFFGVAFFLDSFLAGSLSTIFGISSFTGAFFSFGGFVSFPAITVGVDESLVILSISMRFIICLAAVTIFVAPAVLSPSTFEATASGRDLDKRATELYPDLSRASAIFDPTPGT